MQLRQWEVWEYPVLLQSHQQLACRKANPDAKQGPARRNSGLFQPGVFQPGLFQAGPSVDTQGRKRCSRTEGSAGEQKHGRKRTPQEEPGNHP